MKFTIELPDDMTPLLQELAGRDYGMEGGTEVVIKIPVEKWIAHEITEIATANAFANGYDPKTWKPVQRESLYPEFLRRRET